MFNESLNISLNDLDINESPCVDCNKSPLCNNKTFFESKLFCLEKSNKTNKIIKGNRICESECFVYRDKLGIVNQGCGNCSLFSGYIDCKNCKENNYCNNERIISKQCWEDNNRKCKIEFDDPCYIYRTPTNGVKKGCGKCPFYTCKECTEHLCNENIANYCFGYMGSYKECFDKESFCYIAKIEFENEGWIL
uniref:Uncharacterized protein n=1 Tax=Meloidogyne hapla TaxID=6305 RepID=A0A1I8B000_MELHA